MNGHPWSHTSSPRKGTSKGVLTHINESCHTHDCCTCAPTHQDQEKGTVVLQCHTCEWVATRMNGSHMKTSCHIYEWVTSHIWISLVTHMNGPPVLPHIKPKKGEQQRCPRKRTHCHQWVVLLACDTYECDTYECDTYECDTYECDTYECDTYECDTYEWATSHLWRSHVTHMSEPRHTYEEVMSHIWVSHVTPMKKSCHTYEWRTSHLWRSHVTHVNGSWTHVSRTHLSSGVSAKEFIVISALSCSHSTYESLHIWMCHQCVVSALSCSHYTYEYRCSDVCVMCVWCVCDMTHCVVCCSDMTHCAVCCNDCRTTAVITHMNVPRHTYEKVMSHTWKSHVTHMHTS